MSWLSVGGEKEDDVTPDDKAPPKGALEEAVSLFDELRDMCAFGRLRPAAGTADHDRQLADLDDRRAALAPRLDLAKRFPTTNCPICSHWSTEVPR